MSITAQRFATEDFFSLVGLSGISDEDKNEIMESMSKTVYARVYALAYAELSDSERDELAALPNERVVSFLQAKGFNLEEMAVEEALKYRLELATLFDLAVNPQAA